MEENRCLSLLGLARRAGKLVPGFDACVEAAGQGKAALLLAAADVSEKTWKNLCYAAGRGGVPVRRLSAEMAALSRAIGTAGRGGKTGVLAVTDRGFAAALLQETDKEETAYDD